MCGLLKDYKKRKKSEIMGAFHSTKYSDLKFRVFLARKYEIKRRSLCLFNLFFNLLLGLLDDSEFEMNDVFWENDNITLIIVGILKESATTLRVRYPLSFLMSSKVTFEMTRRAVHSRGHGHNSRSSHVFLHNSLKLVELVQSNSKLKSKPYDYRNKTLPPKI